MKQRKELIHLGGSWHGAWTTYSDWPIKYHILSYFWGSIRKLCQADEWKNADMHTNLFFNTSKNNRLVKVVAREQFEQESWCSPSWTTYPLPKYTPPVSVQFSFISINFIHTGTLKMRKRDPVGQRQSTSVLLIARIHSLFEVWFLDTICHCCLIPTRTEATEICCYWRNCPVLLLPNTILLSLLNLLTPDFSHVYVPYAFMDFGHWNRNSLVSIFSVTFVVQSLLFRFVLCSVPPNLYL